MTSDIGKHDVCSVLLLLCYTSLANLLELVKEVDMVYLSHLGNN